MNSVVEGIKKYSKPFEKVEDLGPIIDEIGDARVVLLGESSHGTSEFYKIRAELSKRLIEEKGFKAICVEGDWPACYQVNRYIKSYEKNRKAPQQVLQSFHRWPNWMWANEEIAEFIEWVKNYNGRSQDSYPKNNVGFYGVDVYSLWESLEETLKYLEENKHQGADLELAKKAFSCFEPHHQEAEKYAIASAFFSESCEEEVTKLLSSIRSHEELYQDDEEGSLNMKVNAMVSKNAENYYRTMVQNDEESWNIRDRHMVDALKEVMDFYGPNSKVIVWEHNTHVGDAAATDMKDEGMVNVGQLVREQFGEDEVYIVGFGTHRGTVIAADKWGENLEKIVVPPAREGSWEDFMHKANFKDQYLIFNEDNRSYFEDRIGHRAIGVVYNPVYEAYGNYVPSIMPDRYDAFIHVNHSNAIHPLKVSKVVL